MNKDKEMDLLNGKKYNIITFGCQMNEHDSETIAGMLQEKGCVETMSRDDSDITIINTCSVRENADKRFFGTLGQLKKLKEKNPEYVACVCGCMMQQQHIIDTIKSKYPWVDIIFGTHNIHRFPELLEKVYSEKKKIARGFRTSESNRRGTACEEALQAQIIREHHVRLQQFLHVLHRAVHERQERRAGNRKTS